MTQKEIRAEMERIAKEKHGEITARLDALPAEANTEKRALMIAKNIANHCASFCRFDFCGNFNAVAHRRIFTDHPEMFGHYRTAYEKMAPEEQQAFLAYAFSVWMVRYNFHDPRTKFLSEAKDTDVPAAIFEARVIAGITGEILQLWENFARENKIGGVQ